MRLAERLIKSDFRRDALLESARRGRRVSKFRIFYRTTVWLIWNWILPILGIASLVFHLIWIPYFQPISFAISLAEAKHQSAPITTASTATVLPLIPTPLPSIEVVTLPLILDFYISKPTSQE